LQLYNKGKIMINLHEIDFFRRAGYLRFDHLYSEDEVVQLRELIRSQCDEESEPCLKDELGRVYRLNNIFDRGEVFRKAFVKVELLDILEALAGPNIEFIKNRYNHATVNTSNDTQYRLHRDILQWSRGIVSIIIYLDDATVDSGATHIIPTSQYLPYVGTPNNGGTWMDEHHVFAALLKQSVQVEVKRGGVLIFDSLAFHSVGQNKGGGTRMSMAGGYTSVDELYPIHDNVQREVVRGERLYRGSIKDFGEQK